MVANKRSMEYRNKKRREKVVVTKVIKEDVEEEVEEDVEEEVEEESSASFENEEESSEEEEESSEEEEDESGKEESSEDNESGKEENESDDDNEMMSSGGGGGYTDENADWLTLKKETSKKKNQKQSQLLSSSSSSDNEEDDNDNDDNNNDIDDDSSCTSSSSLLQVEKESKRIQKELKMEQMEADAEFQHTISQHTSIYNLPTMEQLQKEQENSIILPPSELRDRIDSILEVLTDFKARRQPHRSRSDYIAILTNTMSDLYGYIPNLLEHILSILGPNETHEFLLASEQTRPLVIRTNTLRTRRKDLAAALLKRGAILDPLATWSKVGLLIQSSPVPIGATPEYLAGHYAVQGAASLCPVLALDIQPSPKLQVLDVASAPGGKTGYIAQLMRNMGVLVANDAKKERQKATIANLQRLGVKNTISCFHDGRKLGTTLFPRRFHRVLLDAPCSGLGVISRDPSVKMRRTLDDIQKCAVLQKELILSAFDALKFTTTSSKSSKHKQNAQYSESTTTILVYSTCSISVLENEEVVQYLLQKRPSNAKLVPTNLDFGKPGFTRYQQKRFHPSMALTRRFYPHVHNMDGFYVAKIVKLKSSSSSSSEEKDGMDMNMDMDVNMETNGSSITTDNNTNNNTNNNIDWAARVQEAIVAQTHHDQPQNDKLHPTKDKNMTSNSNNTKVIHNKDKKKKSQKKRKRQTQTEGEGATETQTQTHTRKAMAISVPPTSSKDKKKKSTNAKMNKPRRQKVAVQANMES